MVNNIFIFILPGILFSVSNLVNNGGQLQIVVIWAFTIAWRNSSLLQNIALIGILFVYEMPLHPNTHKKMR